MSECTHHWTVTSECPFCLREKINYRDKEILKLKDLIRDLNTKLIEQLIISQERFLKIEECTQELDLLRLEAKQASSTWAEDKKSDEATIERLQKCYQYEVRKAQLELLPEIEQLREERDQLVYELHRFEKCFVTIDETLKARTREDEIERLQTENNRLWSLCRNIYGSDKYILEALGE